MVMMMMIVEDANQIEFRTVQMLVEQPKTAAVCLWALIVQSDLSNKSNFGHIYSVSESLGVKQYRCIKA